MGWKSARASALTSDVPIIMLTVRDSDDNVIAALEAGADDYIVKPFSPRQLIARIRALLRRAVKEPQEMLQAGPLTFDAERREVHVGDGCPSSPDSLGDTPVARLDAES